MSISQESIESMKNITDGVAVLGTVGVIIKLLPALASLFTIVWLGIRIWETDTLHRIRKLIIKKLKRNNGEGA